jgi:hypothetical protein
MGLREPSSKGWLSRTRPDARPASLLLSPGETGTETGVETGDEHRLDYEVIERLAMKRDKIVVRYHSEDVELHLETYLYDPSRTPQKIPIGSIWHDWGIDLTIYAQIHEDYARQYIPLEELKKLEGAVLCFARWDRSFDGIEYVYHATYKVMDGRLVRAPEFRRLFNFREVWNE